jgi:hypothetical protein
MSLEVPACFRLADPAYKIDPYLLGKMLHCWPLSGELLLNNKGDQEPEKYRG